MAIQKIPKTYTDNNASWTPLKTVALKVNEVIDAIEGGTGSDLVATSLTVTGTTDATTKDTGSIITEGGIGVEKAIFAGTSITATTKMLSGDGTVALPSKTFVSDTDTGIYRIGANNIGVAANGAKVLDIATTGLGVTGATTISTTLDVGTDQTFAKEVDHTISVTTTTTAATPGGGLTVIAGTGATTSYGGNLTLKAGAGGVSAGGNGGAILIQSGSPAAAGGSSGNTQVLSAAGTSTGASGTVSLVSGNSVSGNSGSASVSTGTVSTLGTSGSVSILTGASSTSGNTGSIQLTTGNAVSGTAGNITITPGTTSSTTIAPSIIVSKAFIYNPANTSVASGGTITGPQLVAGHITATGATGSWNLPTAAQITTAIGATPVGTYFDFIFNAASMTATNTATLVVGTNMTVMSAPAITGGGSLTVTQNTQVVGVFRVVFDSATTCKISRIA